MKTIIVTGGAGYIGSHIVPVFARAGYNIISLDLTPRCWGSDLPVSSYIVNLQHYDEIVKVLDSYGNIDGIIHCAGELGIERSFSQKSLFYQQNVLTTDNLLCAAVRYKIKNFIFASSASVYADSSSPVTRDYHISAELSPYSMTKVLSEEKIKSVANFIGLNYVIFRYFNVIGCDSEDKISYYQYLQKPNLIPNILKAYTKNECLFINGNNYHTKDGTCVRDYIDVRDLAELHLNAYRAMVSDKWTSSLNGVYNAGSGRAYSVMDVFSLLRQIVGQDIKHAICSMRLGDNPFLCANINYTEKIFNWRPRFSIKDTLELLLDKTETFYALHPTHN